jgi:hypothetical protein
MELADGIYTELCTLNQMAETEKAILVDVTEVLIAVFAENTCSYVKEYYMWATHQDWIPKSLILDAIEDYFGGKVYFMPQWFGELLIKKYKEQ